MKEYIGVKRIKARKMNRLDYNEYRGWDLPEDERPDDEGYLVEYTDSTNANHPDHSGYISWSPKDVFESAYIEQSSEGLGRELADCWRRVYEGR